MRTNILQNSLIHFSLYFCAFLVRIDLQCKISYFLISKNNSVGFGEGALSPPQYNEMYKYVQFDCCPKIKFLCSLRPTFASVPGTWNVFTSRK